MGLRDAVGGERKKAAALLAAVYACLRWEEAVDRLLEGKNEDKATLRTFSEDMREVYAWAQRSGDGDLVVGCRFCLQFDI